MNAPNYLSLLRKKNEEKCATRELYKPQKGFTQFTRLSISAKKADFSEAPPPANETADAVISWGWLLHFSDRDVLEVYVNPARSHAEILVQYPEALVAEPLPERPATSLACSDCFGYRRHGESGYCYARPDLPPAYGERHPLRLIPDAGACEKWWPRGVITPPSLNQQGICNDHRKEA